MQTADLCPRMKQQCTGCLAKGHHIVECPQICCQNCGSLTHHKPTDYDEVDNFVQTVLCLAIFLILAHLNRRLINSSQVEIKYEFSTPFRYKRFSKYDSHAEIKQFLWPFNYLQNTIIKQLFSRVFWSYFNHFNF